MSEPKLNKRLLRKVRNRIANIPESYDQSTWVGNSDASPCGTTACLAGETIIAAAPSVKEGVKDLKTAVRRFNRGDSYDAGVVRKARTLLGIGIADAEAMFGSYGDGWPAPFARQFARASKKRKSEVAAAYLDECLRRGKVIW